MTDRWSVDAVAERAASSAARRQARYDNPPLKAHVRTRDVPNPSQVRGRSHMIQSRTWYETEASE